MKLEILTSAEIVPAIQREVARMAAAGEIKIEMEFSIAADPDFLALKKQVAALEKSNSKQAAATAPASARFDAVNDKN